MNNIMIGLPAHFPKPIAINTRVFTTSFTVQLVGVPRSKSWWWQDATPYGGGSFAV
jgi:hypothetical protein